MKKREFKVCQQKISPHLLCSICHDVYYNPMRSTCGHTFCGQCLTEWLKQKKNCPTCRGVIARNYQYDKDILAAGMVGELEIECLRCHKWKGLLQNFKKHKAHDCEYVRQTENVGDAIEIDSEEEIEIVHPPPQKFKRYKLNIIYKPTFAEEEKKNKEAFQSLMNEVREELKQKILEYEITQFK